MSMFLHELYKLMGTKLLMSTVFHPQTDGAMEQANHSIGQVLRMVIQDDCFGTQARLWCLELKHYNLNRPRELREAMRISNLSAAQHQK